MVSAVASISTPRLAAGQRHSARARLNLPARLMTFNGTGPCTLMDLSCNGAKLAASECPRLGAVVLFGTVRWTGRGLFGIEFDAPVEHDEVVAMRRYADSAPATQRQAMLAYARKWVQGKI
jgi:hypothetical protein